MEGKGPKCHETTMAADLLGGDLRQEIAEHVMLYAGHFIEQCQARGLKRLNEKDLARHRKAAPHLPSLE